MATLNAIKNKHACVFSSPRHVRPLARRALLGSMKHLKTYFNVTIVTYRYHTDPHQEHKFDPEAKAKKCKGSLRPRKAHPTCSSASSKALMVSSRASCSVLPPPATAERRTLSRYRSHSSKLTQLSKPSCSTCCSFVRGRWWMLL